ncbi:hypothetical protein [Spartinivicinus ruber]|uniref:hypothetical protein n=1 Tax=Spartinivicinus ruber TaxID=2683272 RepID=UPI0013CF6D57|nr:hypothetical protein [Spartinivicinus ruber]
MPSKFEELANIKEYDEIKKAIKNGETELVPDAVVTRLLDGENPVKVWREHRGLKQKQRLFASLRGSSDLCTMTTSPQNR